MEHLLDENDSSDFQGFSADIESTGLLIIRAWTEKGSSEPLRAKIRLSRDISSGIERTTTVVSVDAVLLVVKDWLETLLQETNPPT